MIKSLKLLWAGLGSVGKNAFAVFGMVFAKGKAGGIVMLLAALLLINTGVAAIQQGSLEPFKEDIGYKFLRIDQTYYEDASYIIPDDVQTGGFWKKAIWWFEFLYPLWFTIIFVYVLWKIYAFMPWTTESHYGKNLLHILIIFVLFQSTIGLIYWFENDGDITGDDTVSKAKNLLISINPFKGYWKLINNLTPLIQEVSGKIDSHSSSQEALI